MFVIFPKFCFEQTISVDFFFCFCSCIYVDMIACLPNLIQQCVKLNISCGIEHLLFLRKTK